MVRVEMRAAALAATLLLFGAACGSKSHGQPTTDTEVDALAGAGHFEAADAADVWRLQAPDGAALTLAPCAGFSGKCASITGADLGGADYDAQLLHWSGADVAPRFVTLTGGKAYTIRLKARASTAGKAITVSLEDALYQVVGAATFTLTASPAVYTGADIQIPSAKGDRTVAVKVGVGGAENAGVTFDLDDLVLLEKEGEAPPPPSSNLLAEGDFESSPDASVWNHWSNGGGNAAFAVADCSADGFTGKCMKITGSNFGSDPWSTQLVQWGGSSVRLFSIDGAKTYTVKFKARATAPGATLVAELQSDDYTKEFKADAVTLTDTATPYAKVLAGATGSLAFKFNIQSPSGTAQQIELDDLELVAQ